MPTELGNYKGNATITIKDNEGDPKGFTFGQSKARKIASEVVAVMQFAGADLRAIAARLIAAADGVPAGSQTSQPRADPMGVDRQYEDDCQRRTGA